MPALVLRNGFEIEIYDTGSAVLPINDRVVYSKRTVRLYSEHACVEKKVCREFDKIVKKGGKI